MTFVLYTLTCLSGLRLLINLENWLDIKVATSIAKITKHNQIANITRSELIN